MTKALKPASSQLVSIRVIVHLDDGRSLVESLELPEDIKSLEEIVFHIWEDTSDDEWQVS